MNIKDILNNKDLREVDKEIDKTLKWALNCTILELQKTKCEKYLIKTSSHGTDLTGSSIYYSLYLYFFRNEVISGFRENLISLIFVIDIKNMDDFNVELAIESVYEIKHKRINLKDFQSNSTNGFFVRLLICSLLLLCYF